MKRFNIQYFLLFLKSKLWRNNELRTCLKRRKSETYTKYSNSKSRIQHKNAWIYVGLFFKQQITKHQKKFVKLKTWSDRKKIEMANTPNLQKVTSKLLKLNLISTKRYTVYMIHTVRNLHFLSKNSTLISRENCRVLFGEKLVKMLCFWPL